MKILLVRLREIGDVVFTTPAVRAIRQRFPDAHLTYVVEPQSDALLAFVYAFNNVILPSCTPIANAPPVTLSGVPYNVSWSAVLEPNADAPKRIVISMRRRISLHDTV